MAKSREQKLLSDLHDVEVGIKRPKISGQEIASLNSNSYPDNFHIGQAIGNGSCFFDSFRQSLEQQKGIEVTVEQLREDCKAFAQNNPPEWFVHSIANSDDNDGQHRSETVDGYTADIMRNSRWGDPDVEGRILCEKYKVKLHVIENQTVDNQDLSLHELIDNSGSKSAGEYNKVDYDDSSIVYIINKGGLHFEPLLDRNKSLAKQLQEETKLKQEQEQEDFLLAKKLQLDEILEYCNLSKDISERAEVEKGFDKLLAENADGKIGDVVEQCVSEIKQRIECSEEQNPSSLPRCSMEESRTEKTFHQQQIS
ncbi:OTU-like cysteine protease family protein [Trichonephila clavata]|uniref:OTU-like cysteine protease family protein n=1 Tax=Trichonephila clavata TaxID=2740835 RepID=A0A8X6GDE4_TRICU|nr:OTU-like cysteine protease family protein [Trichonephila clavata]